MLSCLAGERVDETCGYSYLLGAWSAQFQQLTFANATDQTWSVNLQARRALAAALGSGTTMHLELQVTWRRQYAVDGAVESLYHASSLLSDKQRAALLKTLSGAKGGQLTVDAAGIFPKFVRLPSVGSTPLPLSGVNDKWHTFQNLSFVLISQGGGDNRTVSETEWWGLGQSDADRTPFDAPAGGGLQLIVASDGLAGGRAASSIVAGGVLAFYTVVVLAIGRAARSMLGDSRYRLIVDELPLTRDLIALCEAVYIARREKQLLRETELQETILRLYRSPEALLALTGSQLKYD
eukprot:6198858-Pleurochrysis_carterae.AAC.4